MKDRKTYLSKDAHPLLAAYLREQGCDIIEVATNGIVSAGISNHPDVFMCRLGADDGAEVFFAPEFCGSASKELATGNAACVDTPALDQISSALEPACPALGPAYPADCLYNAACTGNYFIHKLSVTAPELLKAAESRGMTLVDVPQGYAKCSTVVVDENTVITYDRGIAKACSGQPWLTVLLIEAGHVLLPGFDAGFIGGASGRVGNTMIFNGDLSAHPDFEAISGLIGSRGLELKYFPEYPLTDIGSII